MSLPPIVVFAIVTAFMAVVIYSLSEAIARQMKKSRRALLPWLLVVVPLSLIIITAAALRFGGLFSTPLTTISVAITYFASSYALAVLVATAGAYAVAMLMSGFGNHSGSKN